MPPKTALKQAVKKSGAVCVLASGGADSSILLIAMTERYSRVIPVYVRNGLYWEKAELYWLRRFLKAVKHPAIGPLRVLDLPMKDVYGNHWSMTGTDVPDGSSEWAEVYLPGRNLILLSKAAVYCGMNGIGAIALGPLKTNQFADSSPEFFSGFERLSVRALGRPLEILTPLMQLSKREVMELGRHLPLELTFSCLKPLGNRHCGDCNKCAERRSAFAEAGRVDRTRYRRPARVHQERTGVQAARSVG